LKDIDMSAYDQIVVSLMRIALFGAILVIGFCVTPGLLATISRSADVQTALIAAWSMMRAAHSWRHWLPTFRCGAGAVPPSGRFAGRFQ
jgi:hypothetical protein